MDSQPIGMLALTARSISRRKQLLNLALRRNCQRSATPTPFPPPRAVHSCTFRAILPKVVLILPTISSTLAGAPTLRAVTSSPMIRLCQIRTCPCAAFAHFAQYFHYPALMCA